MRYRPPTETYPPGTRLRIAVDDRPDLEGTLVGHRAPFGTVPFALVQLDSTGEVVRVLHRNLTPDRVHTLDDDRTRCTATTRKGDRCGNRARPDTDRCANHRSTP